MVVDGASGVRWRRQPVLRHAVLLRLVVDALPLLGEPEGTGPSSGFAVAAGVETSPIWLDRTPQTPTSTARTLQEAMVHTWTSMFLPATLLAGIGVAALIAGQVWPPPSHASPVEPTARWLALSAVYLVGLFGYAAAHRPNLGASD